MKKVKVLSLIFFMITLMASSFFEVKALNSEFSNEFKNDVLNSAQNADLNGIAEVQEFTAVINTKENNVPLKKTHGEVHKYAYITTAPEKPEIELNFIIGLNRIKSNAKISLPFHNNKPRILSQYQLE